MAALATRIEPGIDIAAQPLPAGAAKADPLTVHWETTLTPTESGEYNLGVETDGFFRVFLDGKPVTMANYPHGVETVTGKTHLECRQAVQTGSQLPEDGQHGSAPQAGVGQDRPQR